MGRKIVTSEEVLCTIIACRKQSGFAVPRGTILEELEIPATSSSIKELNAIICTLKTGGSIQAIHTSVEGKLGHWAYTYVDEWEE